MGKKKKYKKNVNEMSNKIVFESVRRKIEI